MISKRNKRIQKLKLFLISEFFGIGTVTFALGIIGALGLYQSDIIGILQMILQILICGICVYIFGKMFFFYNGEWAEIE